jgi:hypothetical protein
MDLPPIIFREQKTKNPPLGGFFLMGPDGVLLSHGEIPHYPCAGHRSALIRFTSEFVMWLVATRWSTCRANGAVSLWLPRRAG